MLRPSQRNLWVHYVLAMLHFVYAVEIVPEVSAFLVVDHRWLSIIPLVQWTPDTVNSTIYSLALFKLTRVPALVFISVTTTPQNQVHLFLQPTQFLMISSYVCLQCLVSETGRWRRIQ
jgi:hypothetical protein